MKQTFEIPEGCKEVTIEQIDNQIITTFEPSKPVFKRGDVCKFAYSGNIFILDKIDSPADGSGDKEAFIKLKVNSGEFSTDGGNDSICLATSEEKERLLTAMHEAGKDFDFEKMEIVDYRWKPKLGEKYFYPDFDCEDMVDSNIWDGVPFDIGLFEMGIIVKAKEQATELAKKMLNAIK